MPAATATKSPATRQPSDRYVAWVRSIRELRHSAIRAVVSYFKRIKTGVDSGLWREGSYQSLDRFLHIELNIHPQRWQHMCLAMERFGEEWIGEFGFEAATSVLRTPAGSEEEKSVLHKLEEMKKERGGSAPSAEAVQRVVLKYVPPQRPVDRQETEEDRLRAEVRRLEEENRKLKAALKEAEQKLKRRG